MKLSIKARMAILVHRQQTKALGTVKTLAAKLGLPEKAVRSYIRNHLQSKP